MSVERIQQQFRDSAALQLEALDALAVPIAAAVDTLFGALANGNNKLAGVCLADWLGMTAWFCFKRLKSTALTPSHVLEMAWTSLWIPFLSVYWRIYGAVKFRVVFI